MTGEVIHNTGNPVPSSSPLDREDNTRVFDAIINSASASVVGRTGAELKTIRGIEAEVEENFAAEQVVRETAFQDFLVSLGFSWIGDYAAGVTFTARNQYVVRSGTFYKLGAATPLPYVITGTWATDQPKLSLIEQPNSVLALLAAADGATLVQNGAESVAAGLSATVRKSSANGAALIPSGTSAERPSSASPGMLRYNSSVGRFERRSATAWLDHGQMDGPFNEGAVQALDAASIGLLHLYNNTINVSGTTAITSLGAGGASGITRRLVFTTALTLTHNATSLILPGGASITTAPGDVAEVVCLGNGNWRCFNYSRANGLPAFSGPITKEFTSGNLPLSGGGLVSAAHNFGAPPKLIQGTIVFLKAVQGWSIGDETLAMLGPDRDDNVTLGNAVYWDNNNVYVRLGSSANGAQVYNKATGGQSGTLAIGDIALKLKVWG